VDVSNWARVERHLGTLPPSVLGEALIAELSATVALLVDEGERRGFRPGPASERFIDVELSDRTRIVGSVPCRLQPPSIGPANILYSRAKPFHRTAAWLDLMALVAMDPFAEYRSLVVTRPSTPKKPPEVVELVPRTDGAEGRRTALAALEVIVDCFRRGSREPLALFPTLSYQTHFATPKANDWIGFAAPADGDDPATSLVYGHHDFRSLMEMPGREDDPPGPGGKVERLAHYLFGAMAASAVDLNAAVTNAAP
jgi:hypothetical protein